VFQSEATISSPLKSVYCLSEENAKIHNLKVTRKTPGSISFNASVMSPIPKMPRKEKSQQFS